MDGANSVFERELPDAEIVISQPFWPAYLTAGAHRQGTEAQARDHGGHRVGSRRSPGRHRAGDDGRRGHLLQQHQRVRARRDDDPGPGAQLHPVVSVGRRRRLEHRGLRVPLLRSGRDGGRHGGRRTHRHGGAAPAQALRRQAALHRPASAAGRCRARAERDLPPDRRGAGAGL